MKRWLLALVILAQPGCNDCARPGYPAINVVARDSVAGTVLTAGLAFVTDREYADTAYFNASVPAPLAPNREGSYDLRVIVPGYRIWRRRNIRVRDDGCGVEPVSIEALMQPEG
jgi:hypothetical protein